MNDLERLREVYPDMWWVFHYKLDLKLKDLACWGFGISLASGVYLSSYKMGWLSPPAFLSGVFFGVSALFLDRARKRVIER